MVIFTSAHLADLMKQGYRFVTYQELDTHGVITAFRRETPQEELDYNGVWQVPIRNKEVLNFIKQNESAANDWRVYISSEYFKIEKLS